MIYNEQNEPIVKFAELADDIREHIFENYIMLSPTDQFYLHKKGGLYWKMFEGKLTDNESDVIIYKHIYPHEVGIWVRDKKEFEDGRFRRVYDDNKGTTYG